jgi:hypothetical protein
MNQKSISIKTKEKNLRLRIKALQTTLKSLSDKRVIDLIKYEITRLRIDICELEGTIEYNGHEIEGSEPSDKCVICGVSIQDLIDFQTDHKYNQKYVSYNRLEED